MNARRLGHNRNLHVPGVIDNQFRFYIRVDGTLFHRSEELHDWHLIGTRIVARIQYF